MADMNAIFPKDPTYLQRAFLLLLILQGIQLALTITFIFGFGIGASTVIGLTFPPVVFAAIFIGYFYRMHMLIMILLGFDMLIFEVVALLSIPLSLLGILGPSVSPTLYYALFTLLGVTGTLSVLVYVGILICLFRWKVKFRGRPARLLKAAK